MNWASNRRFLLKRLRFSGETFPAFFYCGVQAPSSRKKCQRQAWYAEESWNGNEVGHVTGLMLLQTRKQMGCSLAVMLNRLNSSRILCILSALLMLPSVNCYCIGKFYARPSEQTISHKGYSNDQYCSFTIEPSTRYRERNGTNFYFLEITWKYFFDVRGTMPDCENDYVEVFLTRYVVLSSCGNAG